MVIMEKDVPRVAMPTVKPVVQLLRFVTAIVGLVGEVQTVSKVSYVYAVGSVFYIYTYLHQLFLFVYAFIYVIQFRLTVHSPAHLLLMYRFVQ